MLMDNKIYESLLKEVTDLDGIPEGAFNLRADGKGVKRKVTENVDIRNKEEKGKSGIDIIVKEGTENEFIYIPVVLSKSGLNDLVYNDFHIGDNAKVTIVAGCAINNPGDEDSSHDGIHRFFIGKNSEVEYIEKHYGEGHGKGHRSLNPETIIEMDEGSYMHMESIQIQGVDSTTRFTEAKLKSDATLIINESIMTDGNQFAKTDFQVDLNGENSSANIASRSVAKGNSRQEYISTMDGNNKCSGHTECDAIIVGNGIVKAAPVVVANHPEAALIHEATIGRIAGEQLVKLMTLGLTQEEAEEEIIAGFIR